MSYFELNDLMIAYRKAKVDLYYSSDPRLIDLLEYEESLASRLSELQALLDSDDETWVEAPEFVGSFSLAPKLIIDNRRRTNRFQISDPREEWTARNSAPDSIRPTAEFRVMAHCSVAMHVFTTLWLIHVGQRLESQLDDNALGSRLRRTPSGNLNLRTPGSFEHYFEPYRKWRDEGLASMTAALDEGQAVIAMTADVSSFYHLLDPTFLLEQSFIEGVLGVELNSSDEKLHRLFVRSLQAWNRLAAEQGGWQATGIPVGLPASAVIANLALTDLDRLVVREVRPRYYGRYVDDIILVIDAAKEFTDPLAVWNWIIERSGGRLTTEPSGDGSDALSVRFSTEYLAGSDVIFDNSKNKIFRLSGESGRALIGSIQKTIDERASEWRAFTPIPSDPRSIPTDLAVAIREDGDNAATLRDADAVSTRRSAFAIRLRDFEAYERDLDLDSWADQRTAFFDAVCRTVLVLPNFFELASYMPRLVKLAAACGDSEALSDLFRSVRDVYRQTLDTCNLTINAYRNDDLASRSVEQVWGHQLARECLESLASGMATDWPRPVLQNICAPLLNLDSQINRRVGPRILGKLHLRLFLRDLAHRPYRFALLEPEYGPTRGIPSTADADDDCIVSVDTDDDIQIGLDLLVDSLRGTNRPSWPIGSGGDRGSKISGLLFATRPPNAWELFLALRGKSQVKYGFAPASTIQTILMAMRGYAPLEVLPEISASSDGYPTLTVNERPGNGITRIAMGMLQTSINDCVAAAVGTPRLDPARYEELKHLFNEAAKRHKRPHYLVLPELSLPTRWFIPFAKRLRRDDINLIAGVEYLQGDTDVVHNQVWCALDTGGRGGLPYVVYPQDKQVPAPGEEVNLSNHAGLKLEPRVRWASPKPPVLQHKGLHFALLICSEMTNISYRSSLRGRIDALIVPEWNQDLSTFGALVESASLDIHAYIVQVNNRTHGDTRIRAPRTKDWQRDVVRLRGGSHNFAVVGEIDYFELREFQSARHRPEGPFKPIPNGFEIAKERWRVPKLRNARSGE